jgi:hypothetical protein
MVLFILLGSYLLFQRRERWAPYAAGIAFVIAIMIKPLSLVVAAAAASSLALARDWHRLKALAVSGLVGSLFGIAWATYVTQGILGDVVRFQVERFATRSKGMWAIDSGMMDMMRASGIETPFEQAMSAAREFYGLPQTCLPAGLLLLSVVGLISWLRRTTRSNTAFVVFLTLWPISSAVLNFAAADFVSPRYFVPYLAFSALLLAGVVATPASSVGRAVTVSAAAIVCAVLAVRLVTIVRQQDAWYFKQADAIARDHPEVVSFSPIYFAATGTEPGCGFENPALTYGDFGVQFLAAPSLRKFAFSDERIIECLQRNPRMTLLVDLGFYLFNRSGSPLRRYLDGEGANQLLFFSRQDMAQWNQPVPSLGLFP